MTVTTRSRKASKQAELHYIARAQFKATGAILYGVQSGENVYHVTICAGRVTGCCNANGEDCKGYRYQGHCKHSDYAMSLEAARAEQIHEAGQVEQDVLAEMVAHDDVAAHVEDSIRSNEFVNPFAGLSKEQQREAYRAMYPDDFGFAA